jgi:hypothetical protein
MQGQRIILGTMVVLVAAATALGTAAARVPTPGKTTTGPKTTSRATARPSRAPSARTAWATPSAPTKAAPIPSATPTGTTAGTSQSRSGQSRTIPSIPMTGEMVRWRMTPEDRRPQRPSLTAPRHRARSRLLRLLTTTTIGTPASTRARKARRAASATGRSAPPRGGAALSPPRLPGAHDGGGCSAAGRARRQPAHSPRHACAATTPPLITHPHHLIADS